MRREPFARMLAVLLMSGLLALPAVAQDDGSSQARKSPCDQHSMHHGDMDRTSGQTMMRPGWDDYGYYDEYGYDEYGYDQYGYYDDYGYYGEFGDPSEYGYYDDYGYGYDSQVYGYEGYGDEYGEYDYPPADPDEFIFGADRGSEWNVSRRDRQTWQDEPTRRSPSFGQDTRPYEYQSTGFQFGRSIEARVVGLERGQELKLRLVTPDGENRVLFLGDPEHARANLPSIREGDIIVVQGNMVEMDRQPYFKAMQVIAEDGTPFRLQDTQVSQQTPSPRPMTFGYEYGVETDTDADFEYERPQTVVREREYVFLDDEPIYEPQVEVESWRTFSELDRRRDYSRRGERSKEDVDRAARFGYKNARNVESTYSKHQIQGRVVSLQTIDADEYGGRVVVGRVLTVDGEHVDVVLGSPQRVQHVRPGSSVKIEGTSRMIGGSNTVIAQDVTVIRLRDSSWSGGSTVARRAR